MSKRAGSSIPTVKPLKLTKVSEVTWNTIPDDEDKASRDFKTVDAGPKLKTLKSFVLNYKPRVDLSVCLHACNPELRFTSPDSAFTMTGHEFVLMTGSHIGISDGVRLEATEDDGFRLARYGQTSSGMSELNPIAVFEMSKYTARRLKSKEHAICNQVAVILANEKVILKMFESVADVYKSQYALLNSTRPIHEHFNDIARVVETYVHGVVIVKAFLEKLDAEKLMSEFNHYSLLATVLSQRDYLYELLL